MKILFMLPAAKGVYSDEAAQRRINELTSKVVEIELPA